MKTKKIFIIAMVLILMLPACAERDRIITFNELPVSAQNFVKKFTNKQTSFIKLEREGLRKEYDVIFTDGSTIEFNGDGVWTDVNCRQSNVPSSIVPTPILEYVQTKYKGASILQIEQYRQGYEIELSNDLEIKFDKNFRVKDVDD